jgi:hypothetical protein
MGIELRAEHLDAELPVEQRHAGPDPLGVRVDLEAEPGVEADHRPAEDRAAGHQTDLAAQRECRDAIVLLGRRL